VEEEVPTEDCGESKDDMKATGLTPHPVAAAADDCPSSWCGAGEEGCSESLRGAARPGGRSTDIMAVLEKFLNDSGNHLED
jgi:hypothetical protein